MPTSLSRFLAVLLFLAWMGIPAPADEKDEDSGEEKNEEPVEKKSDPEDFHTFTSARGDKTLKLKVVARIDDETYKVENPEGKVFNIKAASVSRSDQRFLDFWEPDAIFNLKTAKLPEVLDQMGYSALDLTAVGSTFLVNVTVDGKSGKFLLNPDRGWSTFDPAAAKEIGMNLTEGRVTFTDNTGKTSRSKRGTVKEFKAGEVTITSHDFEVLEVAKMFRGVPANTIGAMGGDLLKRFNAMIDYGGKRLFVKKDK